ncbi:MAG TPA: hypothetical protein VE089_05385 [Nitrososphaeraceae archaeon]|nr:hypothetical protein [Nitrososphaeraceae archaeon]
MNVDNTVFYNKISLGFVLIVGYWFSNHNEFDIAWNVLAITHANPPYFTAVII